MLFARLTTRKLLAPLAGLAVLVVVAIWLIHPLLVNAANFPMLGRAVAENTQGYLEFAGSSNANVRVNMTHHYLSGYAWSEDLGWIDFREDVETPSYAVTYNETTGALAGEAYVVSTGGYLNFDTPSNVILDLDTGTFSGYAFSDDIGWINFTNSNPELQP